VSTGAAAAPLLWVCRRLLYGYRVLGKWFSFLIFGTGTLLLVFPVLPLMALLFHPRRNFQRRARLLVSRSFRVYIGMMRALGLVTLEAPERHVLNAAAGKIIVANHPSLLDVVMLISLIPNADVMVRGSLVENPVVSGVIRRLYILNTLDFERLAASCAESLGLGNCVVIFPEGTRTPRGGPMRLRKGAARIALLTGAEIIALHIGGTDKYGLGKRDPFTAFNPTGRYGYHIGIRGRISPGQYAGMETPKAVRRLNAEILRLIQGEGEA
jgi:1-acyl-sn-glycerol-3-phosphate acyltransferase